MICCFWYFQDKLPAVLRIYRDTLITVMKASIKATVAELLPVLTARPIDSDSVTGDRETGPLMLTVVFPPIQDLFSEFSISYLNFPMSF